MRILVAALLAFMLTARAVAQAVEIPETHLLLLDRGALKPADPARDGQRFEVAEKPIYRQLLASHKANLILDRSAAPAHWTGLDVTGEAVSALHAAVPDWAPSEASEPVAVVTASPVRMLFADIASYDPLDAKVRETLAHVAAGKGATLVLDKKAVVIGAPEFDVTAIARSSFQTYRESGSLPLVVGGPDLPMARVAILDRTALMRNSAAGRDIAEQVRAITAKVENALRSENQALRRDGDALKEQIPRLAPEARSQAVRDFTARQKAFAAKVQERQAAITAAVTAAQKKIEVAASPIVFQILNDGHANMLLDRMSVVASDDALDITAPAIEKLNAALPRAEIVLDPAQTK
jgi:Skp family chaperone for outer membrane proteins